MACLFVEQLTVIDGAYLHVQRGLVGESWIVDVELEGELDEQSMVLDFGAVKKSLKRAIDSSVDHTLIVPARASGLERHDAGTESHLWFRGPAAGAVEHLAPQAALTWLDAAAVDDAALAAQVAALLRHAVPRSVAEVRVTLRHEAMAAPYFHYAHGLKKHRGQCQRIAHGHRSRLEIRVDGVRDAALETAWAARWRDIYLGTRGDRVAEENGQRLRFAYTAQEGRFALELPAENCDVLEGDSTIERIAEHLAARVAAERPGADVETRVYEGLMKGAVARHAAP